MSDSGQPLPERGPSRRDRPASRKRRRRLASADVITDAAATLFLEQGYLGTSMDDVAALARVSKQTVYTHFASKEQLFTHAVLAGVAPRADQLVETISATVSDAHDAERQLLPVARGFVATAVDPQVLRARRLLIGEASRFPDVARAYYERTHKRATADLATRLAQLSEQGLLSCADPLLAAHHFIGLAMWMPYMRVTFSVEATFGDDELDKLAQYAVRAFLDGYRDEEPPER